MTSSLPTSPSKTSLAEEPLLPTYEQFQSTEAPTSETPPPEPTATADEIRDFIVHLLTSKRGLALDHARRIASKWTIGNGKELRSYPPSMYFDIFGREDGWVVYKEVKLCILNHEQSKKTPDSPAMKWFGLIVCLAAFGGVMFGIIHGTTEGIVALTILSWVLFFPIVFATIGCLASFGTSDPEEKIEKELQKCMKKHNDD